MTEHKYLFNNTEFIWKVLPITDIGNYQYALHLSKRITLEMTQKIIFTDGVSGIKTDIGSYCAVITFSPLYIPTLNQFEALSYVLSTLPGLGIDSMAAAAPKSTLVN